MIHEHLEFMIRIARVRVEQPRFPRMNYLAVPDGIEHPKWQPRRSGYGFYMICRKEAAVQYFKKGQFSAISQFALRENINT